MLKHLAIAGALLASPSLADVHDFDNAKFQQLQTEGRLVLLEFFTSTCHDFCLPQRGAVSAVSNDPRYSAITFMLVDMDKGQSALGVSDMRDKSTLILVQGTRELRRDRMLTSKGSVDGFVQKAMASAQK
jgi:hypothetical protein